MTMATQPISEEALDLLDHAGADDTPPPVPVIVLTGFLGAGKTTLLNRILDGDHGLRVAVLVNDFGDINIDADLVTGVQAGVVSLANGCVCCTIRDDLIETVMAAVDLPERPEYVVLEASGVADPAGIASTFNLSRLRDQIRVDGVICMLDAEQVFAVPELMELKIRQVAYADLVVVNKVDLVEPAQIDGIRAWLDERMRRYRLIEAVRADVPLDVVLSAGRFDAAPTVMPERRHQAVGRSATQDLETWSYRTDEPLALETLREVAARLPASVYRAKGIVHAIEVPDRQVVLQVVGRRVDLSIGEPWRAGERRSRIVAIGAAGATDADELRARFDGCLAAPGAADPPA